jgi:hypothetical protein
VERVGSRSRRSPRRRCSNHPSGPARGAGVRARPAVPATTVAARARRRSRERARPTRRGRGRRWSARARRQRGDEARKGLARRSPPRSRGLELRRRDGGFTYIRDEPRSQRRGRDPSTSFTTAFALHALLDARDAELPFDQGCSTALALLAKCKGATAPSYVAQADPLRDGAALRGPLCVHAAARRRRRRARLAAALEKFRERLRSSRTSATTP